MYIIIFGEIGIITTSIIIRRPSLQQAESVRGEIASSKDQEVRNSKEQEARSEEYKQLYKQYKQLGALGRRQRFGSLTAAIWN